MARLWLVGAMLALAGCSVFLRDTPTPIPTQSTQANSTARAETLVVFLCGRGGSMQDFESQGFNAVLRESGVRADIVAVDSHLGYYYKRTVIERLRADVLLPARERGYRRIVLVGVSLGGLGALLNEREHPGAVDAIVLLAPYLGDKAAIFERIRKAGGPGPWAVGRDLQDGGVEEMIWTYLGRASATLPPTWLLYGQNDSLAPGHRLLATLLPPNRVNVVAGAHDWPTWLTLWRDLCFHSDLFTVEKAPTGLKTGQEIRR